MDQSQFKYILNSSIPPKCYNQIMSETKDLENLTSELSGILQTLNQLLQNANQPQPLLEPNNIIKKHPNMTYHEFLVLVLQSKQPIAVTSSGQSYHIQEDLEILLGLSNYHDVNKRSFDEIVAKKRINRTPESVRSRYKDHLQKVGEQNMKKIIKWVQNHGVQGYMTFKDLNLTISLQDPRAPVKVEQTKKKQRSTSLQAAQKKLDKKVTKKKAVPTNCVELNNILKIYTKMVGIPIKTLLQKLDEASGDFVILDNFIEKQEDGKNLWTADEDEILKRGGVEMDLLIKYKSESSVNQRKKYLGLE